MTQSVLCFTIIASLLLFGGCGPGKTEATRAEKSLVIVLCDVTNSAKDSTTLINIKKCAQRVFDEYGDNTIISYCPITNSSYPGPFLEFEKIPLTDPQPMDKEEKMNIELEIRDSIAKTIDSIFRNSSYQNTCIIQGIQESYNSFALAAKDSISHFELVILSDMIEDCNSKLGPIILDNKGNYESSKRRILSKRPLADPQYDLAKMNVAVEIYFASTDQLLVQKDDMIEIWKTILERFGYTQGSSLVTFPTIKP